MNEASEAADLVLKEGVRAAEGAVGLAATGMKNVAALIMALSRQDYKVIGQASAKRLAREQTPSVVVKIKTEDLPMFQKMAKKEYGVLYFIAKRKGDKSGYVNVISSEAYAAKLNCILETLGYPIPEKKQESEPGKKAAPCTPQGKSSKERGSGSKVTVNKKTPDKPSVRGRLAALQAATDAVKDQVTPEMTR